VVAVSYTRLLRQNRDFRLLWSGQVISLLGDWFNFVTLQALLLRLTHEARYVALIWIAQSIPLLVMGPLAGVVVDRFSRKRVMIAADLARAAVALGFLAIHDRGSAWLACPIFAGLSFFGVFFEPARTATVPNITTEEELVTANALSAVTWSTMLTSGAIAGGLLAGFFGDRVAFVLNSISFVGSAICIAGVRVPTTRRSGSIPSGFSDLRAGFQYVRERADIAALLTAKMGWGLTGGSQLLTAIYGERLFPFPGPRGGVLALSLLVGLSGIGTAAGPIVARRISGPDRNRMRWLLAAAFVMGGIFLFAFGSARSLAAAALTLILARFGGSIVWVFSTVLLQLLAHDQYRGRVFAVEGSLFTLAMMLSNLAVAQAIDVHGVSPFVAAYVMGAISLALGGCWIVGLILAGRRPGVGDT
jgi:hypothetical protein